MTKFHWMIATALITLTLTLANIATALDNTGGGKPCDCVLTDNCAADQICGTGSCTGGTDPLNPKTGLCEINVSVGGLENTTKALDSILVAYETAGAKGGGPIDLSVLAELSRLGLSEAQQKSIHRVALALMSMYIGSMDTEVPFRRGYLTPPLIYEKCKGICLGSTIPFQEYLVKAAPRIRNAIVAELRKPDQGHLERSLEQISSEIPGFLTFGRCDYPFPVVGAKFPFRDGMSCLTAEMKDILRKVYQSEVRGK